MPLPKTNFYTTDDIYALPDGQRAELYFQKSRKLQDLSCAICRFYQGGRHQLCRAGHQYYL